jgi:sterol desaturase/sphingolipid hydroxylase (fatty acid hydroxylase superfamily)
VRSRPDPRVYLPVVAIAGVALWLTWSGVQTVGPGSVGVVVAAARTRLIGPTVAAFVAIVFVLERLLPAEPRPALARGHVHDGLYLVLYAIAIVPLIVLMGAGFATVLRDHASWIVLPRIASVPRWVFVVVALVAMDFANWFAHWANHKVDGLWRLHAVHHAQEEMSVLTSFRAHPFVHVSFLVAALPAAVLMRNGVVPAEVITIYICLAALPHANVWWGSGRIGRVVSRVVVTPAFHRLHHSIDGPIDVNMGTILAVWDTMAGCAVYPSPDWTPIATGLRRRPVPVEQVGIRPAHGRRLAAQLAEPFFRLRQDEPSAAFRRTTEHVRPT